MIDWAEAKARLSQLDAAASISPEHVREVMSARARLLGRAPAAIDPGQRLDLVRFGCGAERFALKTELVRSTSRLPKISAVPFGPPALLGLCAARGQLLSVWDPAVLLTGARAAQSPGWLVVLGRGKAELGLAVDDVTFVAQVRAAEVLPLPEALTVPARAHLFEGLIAAESIRVLSGAAILAEPQLMWT